MADTEPPARAPDSPEADWRMGTMEMSAVEMDSTPVPSSLPAVGQAPAALVTENGEIVPLTRPVTSIGRAMDNDIVLEAKGVSRRHAQIRWDSARYVLEDLGSTNGTSVSGTMVGRHPLEDGEEIAFGGVRFLFRLAGR